MSGVRRKLLVVGIDLLLLAVALPFLIEQRVELDRLQAALEAERDRARVVEKAIESPVAAAQSVRVERAVVRPPAPAPAANAAPEPPADPFLAEARRRAAEDPEAAMVWIQNEATGRQRLQAMLEAVAVWAGDEPESALLWLETNAGGLARLETISSGVEFWSREDPQSAADWIAGMANDGSKATAAKTLARNWVKQSPEEAGAWVSGMPPGAVRREASEALVQAWGEDDPEAASIWALKEAEYTGDRELLATSLRQYAAVEPEAAEGFVREVQSAYGASAPEAVHAYVSERAKNDPAETARWMDALGADDPLALDSNARVLAAEWSRSDSVAASAWIADQPAGPRRDAAIQGFTDSVAAYEPEAAAAWSNTISNPDLRMRTLTMTVESWARAQPAEALEWVKNAQLEPALRTALASRIGAD